MPESLDHKAEQNSKPTMACEELVALAIFTSYFTIILVIFLLILSDLYNLSSSHGRRKTRWAFTLLTIGSLVHTWRREFLAVYIATLYPRLTSHLFLDMLRFLYVRKNFAS